MLTNSPGATVPSGERREIARLETGAIEHAGNHQLGGGGQIEFGDEGVAIAAAVGRLRGGAAGEEDARRGVAGDVDGVGAGDRDGVRLIEAHAADAGGVEQLAARGGSNWETHGPPVRQPRKAPAVSGKFAESDAPVTYTLAAESTAMASARSRPLPPRKVDQTSAPEIESLATKASPRDRACSRECRRRTSSGTRRR